MPYIRQEKLPKLKEYKYSSVDRVAISSPPCAVGHELANAPLVAAFEIHLETFLQLCHSGLSHVDGVSVSYCGTFNVRDRKIYG